MSLYDDLEKDEKPKTRKRPQKSKPEQRPENQNLDFKHQDKISGSQKLIDMRNSLQELNKSLEDSRTSNEMLEEEINRLKEIINKMELDLVEVRKDPVNEERQKELEELQKLFTDFSRKTWLSFKTFLIDKARQEKIQIGYNHAQIKEKQKLSRQSSYISIVQQITEKASEKPYRNVFDAAYEFFFGDN